MTRLSTDLPLSSDSFIFEKTSKNTDAAFEALKAALATSGEDHQHAHVDSAPFASDAASDALVTPETLIATYTSGIEKVKFKSNFVEYSLNGQKIKTQIDDPDVPTNLEDPYNIELAFYGEGWSEELLDAFVAASEFLSGMIASGLVEDMAMSTTTGEMVTVDDLRIEASLSQGDGVGVIVGGAEVEAVRSSDGVTPDGLPVLSLMNFDVDDANALLEQGIWDDLVLHEMFHAMGFGSPLWAAGNIVIGDFELGGPIGPFPVVLEADLFFTGDNVVQTVVADGGTQLLQLSGVFFTPDGVNFFSTYDGHWDEDVFENALMTPTLSTEENVLLDITLASMADLGYELTLDLTTEDNPLSEGIDLVAENNVNFTDFAEDFLMLG